MKDKTEKKTTTEKKAPRIAFDKEDLRVLTDLEISGAIGGAKGTAVGCDTMAQGCSSPRR